MPVDGLILLGTSLRMLYVAMLQSIHHGHITIFILAENKKIAISLWLHFKKMFSMISISKDLLHSINLDS